MKLEEVLKYGGNMNRVALGRRSRTSLYSTALVIPFTSSMAYVT